MPRPVGRGHNKMSAMSVRLSVRLSRPQVPRPNSRTESPTLIGRMGAYHASNPWTYLEVNRSKVKRSQGHVVCLTVVAHMLRTKSPRNTKICGIVAHTTGNNEDQVRGQKVKITRLINAETESVSPTNFKLGKRLEHSLSTAMTSYKGLWSWVIARGWGHTVSFAPGGHKTCSILVADLVCDQDIVLRPGQYSGLQKRQVCRLQLLSTFLGRR